MQIDLKVGFHVVTLALLAACAPPDEGGADAGTDAGTAQDVDAGETPAACIPRAQPLCEDQVIQTLNLQPDAAPGLVTTENTAAGVASVLVDATAGGAFTQTPHAYVYARFTDTGLIKVDLDDEAALTSTEWDVAFRRYVIRINSGASGPGCVEAVRLPPAATLEGTQAVPPDSTWRQDAFMTESCELIPDGSGQGTSPGTALSSFYSYNGCLQMTGQVFVLRLHDGRTVKLVVDGFYHPAVQQECQDTGSVATMPSGSGNLRFRWSWMDGATP